MAQGLDCLGLIGAIKDFSVLCVIDSCSLCLQHLGGAVVRRLPGQPLWAAERHPCVLPTIYSPDWTPSLHQVVTLELTWPLVMTKLFVCVYVWQGTLFNDEWCFLWMCNIDCHRNCQWCQLPMSFSHEQEPVLKCNGFDKLQCVDHFHHVILEWFT